jgi:DNA-binding transcriptional ArsR family regulator
MFRHAPKHPFSRERSHGLVMATTAAPVEPRFARVASAIGDPTRARMLSILLGGSSLPAGEIARAAGISPSTASEHLRMLADEGLVDADSRGRHRYFRVKNADVARALETLSVVAVGTDATETWLREPYRRLKYARSCYHHLAGELGVELLESLILRRALIASKQGYELTRKGQAWLVEIGIPPPRHSGERYAYACPDWSERRDHLAGRLATVMLDHFLERRWLVRGNHPRSLKITPQGKRLLLPRLRP